MALDYTCPIRKLKQWKNAKQMTTIGSPDKWNEAVDAKIVTNLFHGLEMLNRQTKPFDVYRKKLRGLKSLLFQDEYNSLMCDIDILEEDLTQFLAHIYSSNEFMELISGSVRKIGTILDLADAIREMDKRLIEFRRIYDLQISELLSSAKINSRNERCKTYRPSCAPPVGSQEKIPCKMLKSQGVLKTAKCRYIQWTGNK